MMQEASLSASFFAVTLIKNANQSVPKRPPKHLQTHLKTPKMAIKTDTR